MRLWSHMRLRHAAIAAAGLSAAGCLKTPGPPDVCHILTFPHLPDNWQIQEARRLSLSLDSLRTVIARTEDKAAQTHLVQEYLLGANQLSKSARDTALANVQRVLAGRKRP